VSTPDPRPSAELDEQFERTVFRSRRFQLVLVAMTTVAVAVALVAAAVVIASAYANQRAQADLGTRLSAECDFNFLLATAPIPHSPPPSALGVRLVVSARAAFTVAQCSGHLPPPSPELAAAARRYGIPLRY
jgi:hypothetical protein